MFALERHELIVMVYVSVSNIKRGLTLITFEQKLLGAGLDLSYRAPIGRNINGGRHITGYDIMMFV